MIKLLQRFGLFLLLQFFTLLVVAQSPREIEIAEAAGEYYAAIIMAKEFKESICGNINIDKKWTDLARARREIYSKFSKSARHELQEIWIAAEENWKLRIRKFVSNINENAEKVGCDKAQKIFWLKFDGAVRRWNRVISKK